MPQSTVNPFPRLGSDPEASGALAFPGDDQGQSLAAMAQRDLDAALQLLAERAQYITGATGTAIALRHAGEHDMLCRASSGLNAPELGALLSTEFGLSGESVRTRQPLRCDDTERDGRVNRESCRELGIASVAVMPVLSDGEVLGVFELFSEEPNAFDERDVSALERLAEMVETAARFAQAATRFSGALVSQEFLEEDFENAADPAVELRTELRTTNEGLGGKESEPGNSLLDLRARVPAPQPASPNEASGNKPLLWSATLATSVSSPSAEAEQSHVPMALRSLRKCQACGFPVSESRSLCVECEEKQWRGLLQATPASGRQTTAAAQASTAQVDSEISAPSSANGSGATAMRAGEAVTKVAHTGVKDHSMEDRGQASDLGTEKGASAEKGVANVSFGQSELTGRELLETPTTATADSSAGREAETANLFFLTAGLEPSQSWLAANKYVLGAIIAVALAIVAVAAMR